MLLPRTTDDGQITDRLRLWYMTSSHSMPNKFFFSLELLNGPEVLKISYYEEAFNSELRTTSV